MNPNGANGIADRESSRRLNLVRLLDRLLHRPIDGRAVTSHKEGEH
jgi:hypothetical protein